MVVEMETIQEMENKTESLLNTFLSRNCTVNKMHDDFGIDLSCTVTLGEVANGREFFVQYKGVEKIAEDDDYVSLQMNPAMVRLWFKKDM